jgi:SAM-dependent MidA family methyltransferase
VRFVVREDTVREIGVANCDRGFEWIERDASPALLVAVRQIEADIGTTLPDGYVSEVCLALQSWLADLANCIAQGFVFLFDYGVSRREYYSAERESGWLRCHYRHRAHNNPLINTGIQDLTAWVDFSAVASAAASNGLGIAGYVSQAHFLLNGGLDAELANFAALPDKAQVELSRQVKLLALPGEMGESFKCIGLAKGQVSAPMAFDRSDRAHVL